MADWKTILSDNGQQLTEEELLKYLDVNISEEEKYAIENKINSSPFEADALQGLLQIRNKQNLPKDITQLNQKLLQLTAKKPRREKRKINMFQWIILTILLLLFICVILYVIIVLQVKTHVHAHIPTSMYLSFKHIFYAAVV
jgi:hypothetical protein